MDRSKISSSALYNWIWERGLINGHNWLMMRSQDRDKYISWRQVPAAESSKSCERSRKPSAAVVQWSGHNSISCWELCACHWVLIRTRPWPSEKQKCIRKNGLYTNHPFYLLWIRGAMSGRPENIWKWFFSISSLSKLENVYDGEIDLSSSSRQ